MQIPAIGAVIVPVKSGHTVIVATSALYIVVPQLFTTVTWYVVSLPAVPVPGV